MKKILLLLALVSIARGVCFGTSAFGPDAKFLYEEVFGTVELLDVIKPDAKPLAPGFYKLSREWVGTLTQIEDKQAQTKLPPRQPESLRLNCIRVVPYSGEIELMGAWFDDAGSFSGSGYRRFRFMRKLRSSEEILQTREFDTLKSWFEGFVEYNSGASLLFDEFSYAHGWKVFGLGKNETIVCQDIWAHVSTKMKPGVQDAATRAFFDDVMGDRGPSWKELPVGASIVTIMTFSEGVFRPANPDSEEERRKYPSEYEKHMERLAKENARIDAHPEPLRSLLDARRTRDKFSELLAYKAAINRFRDKPDPLLIRQLVERLGGDSINNFVEMKMHLEALMDESMGTSYLKLDPWKPENKKIAIKALIDSLPEAPLKDVERAIIIILAETNLVTLKMDEPEFSIDIRALPRTPTSGYYGGVYGSFRIKNELARKTILNRIASELRRRWEASGFCVERYSAPVSEK